MSNTPKTEMVEGIKPGKTEGKDNTEEERSLRSSRVNYTTNENTKIQNQSCKEVPLQIKMEKGNNLRMFCSTTAFKNIKKEL